MRLHECSSDLEQVTPTLWVGLGGVIFEALEDLLVVCSQEAFSAPLTGPCPHTQRKQYSLQNSSLSAETLPGRCLVRPHHLESSTAAKGSTQPGSPGGDCVHISRCTCSSGTVVDRRRWKGWHSSSQTSVALSGVRREAGRRLGLTARRNNLARGRGPTLFLHQRPQPGPKSVVSAAPPGSPPV